MNSLNKIENSVVTSGANPDVLEEVHKAKTHFYREYFANARIYKNATTNQADFRSELEAKKVLELSPSNAETSYWLSFLQNKSLNVEQLTSGLSFPFRNETAEVLD